MITLNVEDKQGGVDFAYITLVINTPPNAIIASPSENELFFVEDEIIFDAYSSYDRDNDDLYYTWTSNIDGEIYSGKYNGFRKRLNAGHHMIELTLDDGRGGIDKELINININTPPIIIIDSPSNYSKFTNSEIVNFIASSSYDSDGDNLEFSWFSSIDGNLGNVGEIGEILSEGTHTITLRVEDKYGSFDEEILIVNIVQDENNEENNAISQNDKESNNNIYFIVIPLIATMIFVVLGFDLTFNYEKFEKGCRFIRNGIPFIATHPDYNCPLENGDMIPDCGSLAAAFTAATGINPKVIGKPNKKILDGLLDHLKMKKEEICFIGDRLMTDIKIGVDFNILNILVLTGETKLEHLKTSDIQPDIIIERNIDLLNYLSN